ncbi:MAG: hypothetical protein H0W69_09515 [Gemmatimonadaceae bacterium]|nr:hypothetical protein [Gemmatimonadaceae bacterium]
MVVWTHPRAEKKVAERIAALGLASWLPTTVERHQWSDRWKNVVCPLFPGYLFARTRASIGLRALLDTPGVLTVVKKGDQPALLTDSFVSELRDAIERSGSAPESVDEAIEFAPGEEVVIVQEGPLRGVRGLVRERRNGRQLVIWVSEIGRGVAFTIGSALVRSLGPQPFSPHNQKA